VECAVRRSEWFLRAALVFLLGYGLIASGGRKHETFPFFAWDLFTKVPKPQIADYDVRILSAKELARTPIYFEDAHLQGPAKLTEGYVAIQRLAVIIDRLGDTQATAERKHFESVYMNSLSDVRYEVVLRFYDIRQRVECRTCFTEVRVLGTYLAA
jgi:hypothetical protein